MKRRNLGLLASASLLALKAGRATADASAGAAPLGAGLTPTGAEAAGNADGSIPAWTGGITAPPAGWQPGQAMPDMFAGEQPVLVIDSSNAAQYADKLSEGVAAMIQKYGFSLKVYPTHRTAAAPQWVYDNIKTNATSAQLEAAGGRFGFHNAYGGIPFPVPDQTDPLVAGAQIVWNHNARWSGYAMTESPQGWVVNGGSLVLSYQANGKYDWPYYRQSGNLSTFDGALNRQYIQDTGPANLVGTLDVVLRMADPYRQPDAAWSVLAGQGRVRRAPEIEFDTPSSQADGIANYDEYYGFNGSLIKYDWKLIGKKEMYIPYNNNGMYLLAPQKVHLPRFLDPDVVRWELHRVWVVEATLHPGERNVLAKRRFYVDEDTWMAGLVDAWDANNNLYKVNHVYNYLRPDLPGVVYGNNAVYNLQTDNYATINGVWNEAQSPSVRFYPSLPDSDFDPEQMAAASQY